MTNVYDYIKVYRSPPMTSTSPPLHFSLKMKYKLMSAHLFGDTSIQNRRLAYLYVTNHYIYVVGIFTFTQSKTLDISDIF